MNDRETDCADERLCFCCLGLQEKFVRMSNSNTPFVQKIQKAMDTVRAIDKEERNNE